MGEGRLAGKDRQTEVCGLGWDREKPHSATDVSRQAPGQVHRELGGGSYQTRKPGGAGGSDGMGGAVGVVSREGRFTFTKWKRRQGRGTCRVTGKATAQRRGKSQGRVEASAAAPRGSRRAGAASGRRPSGGADWGSCRHSVVSSRQPLGCDLPDRCPGLFPAVCSLLKTPASPGVRGW